MSIANSIAEPVTYTFGLNLENAPADPVARTNFAGEIARWVAQHQPDPRPMSVMAVVSEQGEVTVTFPSDDLAVLFRLKFADRLAPTGDGQ